MESVNISEFRSNLLNYLKKAKEGHEIVITSHGETLATIVPPTDQSRLSKAKLKLLAKTAVINDVISPTNDNWDALL